MATAKKEEFARKLEQKTFQLLGPIHNGDKVISEVTITEPISYQVVHAQRAADKDKNKHVLPCMLDVISDLPPGLALRLKARDLGHISRWIKGLNEAALEADGLIRPAATGGGDGDQNAVDPFEVGFDDAEFAALSDDEIDGLESERTFDLLSPLQYEGRTIERLTCREPTIDVMMNATRFKTPAEVSIALVAGITSETIPVINRLVQRDLVRLETWLTPFVQDLMAETGGT